MIACEHGMLKRSCPTCNLKLDMQELQMSIEELIEKYRLQRDDYMKQSNLGDYNRLMAESKINVLTEVIGDLEGVMK